MMIAYKIYLDISITVEGRSYTFKDNFQVDPKDKFESTLRQRTKTWNYFMNRGAYRCVVKVEYKSKDQEDGFIPPNMFDKTFEELGILNGGQLVLVEMRNYNKKELGSDIDDEEGEEEQEEDLEEGEEDMEEQEEEGEEQNEEEAKDSEKVEEDTNKIEGAAISPEAVVSQAIPDNIVANAEADDNGKAQEDADAPQQNQQQ